MRADCFYYTETRHRPWPDQVAFGAQYVVVQVSATETLVEILAAAYAAGLSQGSQRSGCFEVQTDAGIWTHHNPAFVERGWGKLDPAKAVFTPWEA